MGKTTNSLTLVTKEEIHKALSNYLKQRKLHQKEYERRLKIWHKEQLSQLTWWQRNVEKLHLLPKGELLVKLWGVSSWSGPFVTADKKVALGLWDHSFQYTLGRYGSKWVDIVVDLHTSGKEEHMVSSSVLSWITKWKSHSVEYVGA